MEETRYQIVAEFRLDGFGYEVPLDELQGRFAEGVTIEVIDRVQMSVAVRGPGDGLRFSFGVTAASTLEAARAASEWLAYADLYEFVPAEASLKMKITPVEAG